MSLRRRSSRNITHVILLPLAFTLLGLMAQNATAVYSSGDNKGDLVESRPGEEGATSWLAGWLGWKFNTGGQPTIGLQPELHGVTGGLPWELAANLTLAWPAVNVPAGSGLRLEQSKLVLHAPDYKIILSGREKLSGSLLLAETVADRLAWERSTGMQGARLEAGVISARGMLPIAMARWEQSQGLGQWIRQLQLEAAWGQGAGLAARIEGAWSDRVKAQLSLGWARGGGSAGLTLEYRGAGWGWSALAAVRSEAFALLNADRDDLPLWSVTSTLERFRSSYRVGLSGSVKRYVDGDVTQLRVGGEISGRLGWFQWSAATEWESRASSSVPASRRLTLLWNPSVWPGLMLRLDTDDPLAGDREQGERTRLFTLQDSGQLAGWPFVWESDVSWRKRTPEQSVVPQISTNVTFTSPHTVAGGRLSLKGGLTYVPIRFAGTPGSEQRTVLDRMKLEAKWERSSPTRDISLLLAYAASPGSSQAAEWRLEGRLTLPVQLGQPPVRIGGQTTPAGPVDLGDLVFLSGRVFVDNNGNGLFDRGDEPVTEATVLVDERTAVRTDSEGRYGLQLLGAGRHQVTLDLASIPLELGLAPGTEARRAVDLKAGKEGNVVNFALVRLCSLAGLLFLDANGNGLRDSGEPGLGGVFLRLAGTPFSTFTADDGTFAFYDVYPGEWQLVVDPATLPQKAARSGPVEVVLSLAPGESRTGVLLPVPPYVQEIEWTF
ncbi:MAG: hypothetical protein IMX00_03895 [Limnochordales bacterium]|nr:hypothetical protein [Limnochordales bacterium]